MSPMGFKKTEPELYADIAKLKKEVIDLRATLSALVEAAEANAPRCHCGKPAMFECQWLEKLWCEECTKGLKEFKFKINQQAEVLWSALDRAKGV